MILNWLPRYPILWKDCQFLPLKTILHKKHIRMYFITENTLCSTTWYLSWKCKFKLDSTSCVYSFYPLSWLYVREVCDGRTSIVKRGILSAKSYFSTLPTHPEMKAQVSQKAEHVKRNHGNSVTQNSNPVSIIRSSTLEDCSIHAIAARESEVAWMNNMKVPTDHMGNVNINRQFSSAVVRVKTVD